MVFFHAASCKGSGIRWQMFLMFDSHDLTYSVLLTEESVQRQTVVVIVAISLKDSSLILTSPCLLPAVMSYTVPLIFVQVFSYLIRVMGPQS